MELTWVITNLVLGPLRRRSPGSWVISFVACLSAESWVVQSPSNLCLSLTLQSPTYYKHLQNGFQHLSIHFWIFFYTLENFDMEPKLVLLKMFLLSQVGIFRFHISFQGCTVENWYRDNTRHKCQRQMSLQCPFPELSTFGRPRTGTSTMEGPKAWLTNIGQHLAQM